MLLIRCVLRILKCTSFPPRCVGVPGIRNKIGRESERERERQVKKEERGRNREKERDRDRFIFNFIVKYFIRLLVCIRYV